MTTPFSRYSGAKTIRAAIGILRLQSPKRKQGTTKFPDFREIMALVEVDCVFQFHDTRNMAVRIPAS